MIRLQTVRLPLLFPRTPRERLRSFGFRLLSLSQEAPWTTRPLSPLTTELFIRPTTGILKAVVPPQVHLGGPRKDQRDHQQLRQAPLRRLRPGQQPPLEGPRRLVQAQGERVEPG